MVHTKYCKDDHGFQALLPTPTLLGGVEGVLWETRLYIIEDYVRKSWALDRENLCSGWNVDRRVRRESLGEKRGKQPSPGSY